MKPPSLLAEILATNLRYFMERDESHYKNPNALAKPAKISVSSIRNYLDPLRRKNDGKKAVGAPTLDKLEFLAKALGCEVWELLHPDISRSERERAFYKTIQDSYAQLPKTTPVPVVRK